VHIAVFALRRKVPTLLKALHHRLGFRVGNVYLCRLISTMLSVLLLKQILGAQIYKKTGDKEELLGTVVSIYNRDGHLYASVLLPDNCTFVRYVVSFFFF